MSENKSIFLGIQVPKVAAVWSEAVGMLCAGIRGNLSK